MAKVKGVEVLSLYKLYKFGLIPGIERRRLTISILLILTACHKAVPLLVNLLTK